MKHVSFVDVGEFKAREIVTRIMETAPNGVKFAEMNKRVKVLEALEGTPDGDVLMEDAVFETMKRTVEEFPFSNSKLDLARMLRGVLDAKDVDVARIPSKKAV